MTALDAETRWLLACVRSLEGRPVPPPPASLGWDHLLAVAETGGLAPALGFVMKTKPPAAVPSPVQARLHRRLTGCIAGQLILGRELGRVLRRFEREGIGVIPLKGLVLAEMLYPDPALRPSTDLDLLIRPETRFRADGLLLDLGYRRHADAHSWSFDVTHDHATVYEEPGGVRVDLHWSLLSDPRYAWHEPEGLQVWDRAIKIQVAGETATGLCPEDLLLYLAVHLAVHHGLAGLLWYWDLARLLGRWADRLDWETVVARASRWRVRTALYFALLGCAGFFGVSAPAAVMSRLQARGPRAVVLRWLVRRREADRLKQLEHLIALLLVDRARDLAEPLRVALFPSPSWLRARYEGAGSSLPAYYLAHYRRMLSIAGAAKEALARGR